MFPRGQETVYVCPAGHVQGWLGKRSEMREGLVGNSGLVGETKKQASLMESRTSKVYGESESRKAAKAGRLERIWEDYIRGWGGLASSKAENEAPADGRRCVISDPKKEQLLFAFLKSPWRVGAHGCQVCAPGQSFVCNSSSRYIQQPSFSHVA